jgi:hypothetical protein
VLDYKLSLVLLLSARPGRWPSPAVAITFCGSTQSPTCGKADSSFSLCCPMNLIICAGSCVAWGSPHLSQLPGQPEKLRGTHNYSSGQFTCEICGGGGGHDGTRSAWEAQMSALQRLHCIENRAVSELCWGRVKISPCRYCATIRPAAVRLAHSGEARC